jgi:hypothetical protein
MEQNIRYKRLIIHTYCCEQLQVRWMRRGSHPLSESIARLIYITINFLPQQDIRYLFFLHWDTSA